MNRWSSQSSSKREPMGVHEISATDETLVTRFKQALLDDLAALEYMLDHGLVDDATPRIGAEQEMFLVDSKLRPAPIAAEVLARPNDPRFTTEIGKFNLEANLAPRDFGAGCLRVLERDLEEVVGLARAAAREQHAELLLAGILPTAHQYDLTLENLTAG